MTRAETEVLITYAAAIWPKFEVNDGVYAVWSELFEDYPADVVKRALLLLAKTLKHAFAPSMPEIFEAIREVTAKPGENLTAAEAFGLVAERVRRYGRYQSERALADLPPLVRDTVRALGWESVCNSQNPEALRAQFIRAFESQRAATVIRTANCELMALESSQRYALLGATQ